MDYYDSLLLRMTIWHHIMDFFTQEAMIVMALETLEA